MNIFKFHCPACGQRIEAEAGQIGRASQCPTCRAAIVIPAPEKKPEPPPPEKPSVEPPEPETKSPPATPDDSKKETPPAAPAPTPTSATPTDAPPPTQVAVLTPEIKLEVVQAIRELIGEEFRWMPEVTDKGSYAYAARLAAGNWVELPANSPEATRFSLFGAVLREFDRRNVATMATGRKEFLDAELKAAIADVSAGAAPGTMTGERQRPPLTHAQCLTVLAALEKRYRQEITAAKKALAQRKLGNVRLEDLMSKLESEAPIAPEEVATALYHELEEIKERLAWLEAAEARPK